MTSYACIIAAHKSWNAQNFAKMKKSDSAQWHLMTEKEELTVDAIKAIAPRYIFFPHWSYKVPAEISENYECVCFHMTDVPYGRGGSPLQNLIVRGHKETKLTALRMVGDMDAGPVYMKAPLSLEGSATDILKRASAITFDMISMIVENKPEPKPQEGEITHFKRRTPEQSNIAALDNLEIIYDYIRMLDAEGYPRAYIDAGSFRIEFETAEIDGSEIKAKAIIRMNDDDSSDNSRTP